LIHTLAGQRTVIITEHDMEFVRRFSRKVTVLHLGKVLSEGTIDEVQQNPMVVEVYLGRSHGRTEA
jgi:urea transport system ATP-binding protein